MTIALKQVSEPPVPPSRCNPAVPPALEAVVLRAMAKDPADRFADADAFIAALERALAGGYAGPRRPRPEDPVAYLEDEDRRNWGRIALIAFVVLAVAALAVGAYLLLTPEQVDGARRRRQAHGQRDAAAAERGLRGRDRADPVRHRRRRTGSPARARSRASRSRRARR